MSMQRAVEHEAFKAQTASGPKGSLWTGRVMSGLVILFMVMDGSMKLIRPKAVVDATVQLGFPEHSISVLGFIALTFTALYVIPRTAVLGAILLTGYLGGAVAAKFRLDAPLFSQTLFPVYFAILVWGGLYLRCSQLRRILPFLRHPPAQSGKSN